MARFVRVEHNNTPHWGQLDGDTIVLLDSAPYLRGKPTGDTLDLEGARLLAPVTPTKIICIGLNYALHVKESQSATAVPDEPVLFFKPTSAVIGPGGNIVYPPLSERVDYEAELAVVISKRGSKIKEEAAESYIWGYTCANDVTARDLQRKDKQWTRAKGFDTFCPVGPWVETELNYRGLQVESFLNDEKRQSGNTADMLFPIPFLVSYISQAMTLMPGDIIVTGTPEGVGPMQPGDRIEIKVEGIGVLTNQVVEQKAG